MTLRPSLRAALLRGAALLLALGAGSGEAAPAPAASSPGAAAAARAARWLWERQAPDGGWHSETYGLLRSGQSLTPFVLDVLVRVPPGAGAAPEGAVARAVAFVARHMDAEGGLGRAEPSLEDYPTYATSIALRALARADAGAPERLRLARWLRSRQLADAAGWDASHAAYGAWGMGGPVRRPPHTGHVDLSMTRHAVEGLAASGAPRDDPALRRARRFLDRLRGEDGGFHFSTVVLDANKAGATEPGTLGSSFRSYGTATADGVLALLACGVSPSDPALAKAVEALVRGHRADEVPGFPEGEPRRWAPAMKAYYRAAAAEALRRAGVSEAPAGRDWRADLVHGITGEQAADGSFRNRSFLMKEDDPLIATAFALSALLSAQGG